MKEITVLIEIDRSCKMARVGTVPRDYLGLRGMEGNWWDFHPGCHGFKEYGDFNSPQGFARALCKEARRLGLKPKVEVKSYHYYG